MPDERLCLLTVHAHPDDEASKGAGTVARARAEGIKTVLVCCTGGEEGEILNPAMESDEVRARLHEVRMEELAESVRIIGYEELVLLGYRDSGMPESEANADPRSFAQAPLDEAVGRLVAVIRQHRPHVVVTYDEEQSRYPHPDHLRVHEISVLAFDAAGDPERYTDLGEAWQPLKLYYTAWSWRRSLAMHERMLELGLESPMSEERLGWMREAGADDRTTTSVPIDGYVNVGRQALLAHRTQVDPNSGFWFGLPPDEQERIHPFEEYVLARSLVDTELPEDDLFAGIRATASR
ncbi:MAG: mycothiol conjugate amidase Mca [Acidimicrobiia bacterium]